ncbi:hypothetical protein [Helicobacter felis]|uniref:hypothetical protein n=1 Tax=Helicobacter felis TaxID=214 RepID=UPI000CEDD811|nr:hypothetical protein [Helicobacter felis]
MANAVTGTKDTKDTEYTTTIIITIMVAPTIITIITTAVNTIITTIINMESTALTKLHPPRFHGAFLSLLPILPATRGISLEVVVFVSQSC